ncbi:MAG: methyltransferase [Candidatus Latescibacteria bacterium]|nr:methyltransferase [Candidatus Latescibacterota bacterium]
MERLVVPQGQFTLRRFPLRRRETLRAWDAADEYLLHHLAEEGLPRAGSALLICHDAFGALGTALAKQRPQLLGDSHLAQRAAVENLRGNGLAVEQIRLLSSLQAPAGPLDLVLFKVPKSLALLRDTLQRLRPLMHAGTRIIGAGMARDIHASTLAWCGRLIGPTRTSLARKKARLIYCQFEASLDPGPNPYPSQYRLEGSDWLLSNHAHVFSRSGLDAGTGLLLDYIPASGKALNMADLGCGNGAVGLVAAKRNPEAELIFVDESFMAVESARDNFQRVFGATRRARFRVGDGLQGIAPQSVDLVLNNPPFHQQRAVDDAVAWRMFGQAAGALVRGGQLWVVGNRHLGYHVKLKRLLGNCKVVGSNRKFVVLKALKR